MSNQTRQRTEINNGTNNESSFKQSIRLKYVKLSYHYLISNFLYFMLVPLILMVLSSIHISVHSFHDLLQMSLNIVKYNMVMVFMCTGLLIFLGTLYFMSRPRTIYLVNFACYKPDQARKVTKEIFMDRTMNLGIFSQENVDFQKKILERSGLGQETYFPEALIQVPPNPSMAEARKEAEIVMFGAIDELLAKTKVKPKDIGILVVNCSLFNPTPSLSAMIVNHYKLRGNILSYNLGGMGCSAGLISIDLAKELLQVCFLNHFIIIYT